MTLGYTYYEQGPRRDAKGTQEETRAPPALRSTALKSMAKPSPGRDKAGCQSSLKNTMKALSLRIYSSNKTFSCQFCEDLMKLPTDLVDNLCTSLTCASQRFCQGYERIKLNILKHYSRVNKYNPGLRQNIPTSTRQSSHPALLALIFFAFFFLKTTLCYRISTLAALLSAAKKEDGAAISFVF